MSKKNNHLIKFLFILCGMLFQVSNAGAQTDDEPVKGVRDTLAVYKKIKKAFSKHRATTLLYDAIFVDPAPKQYENKPLSDKQTKKDPKKKFEKKYIRSISITVFDPFGYSVHDTTRTAINSFQKIANHYHHTTRHRTIRNNLLFKQGDEVDLLKINESERLLRETGYVNDALIYITKVPHSDSVDIKVVVHDRWTIDAPVNLSFTSGNVTLRDRNFLGFGQQLEQFGAYDASSGDYQYSGNYQIANIHRTFIKSNIYYLTTKDLTQVGVSFDRPFYSVTTKWAGGVTVQQDWGVFKYTDTVEKIDYRFPIRKTYTDVWGGRSYNPGFGTPENRKGTNIIFALRYTDTRYQKRPGFDIDTNKNNVNTNFILGSLGFSLRKYYKDQFIYRFGATEDVPEGFLFQILYGVLYKEETGLRHYSGFEISEGIHLDELGYVSLFANYGTYYNQFVKNNATLNSGFYFFSHLLKNNKWYFRQFINFKYVVGINKLPTERITLRSDEMYGMDNGSLSGTRKMIANLEAVSYAPYNIIGFRFAPLVLVGLGMLQSEQHLLLQSPVYQSYAVGLLLRNENLLNSSFQITYGFYPNLPDNTGKRSRFNPVLSFSLKIHTFTISRPTAMVYE